MTDGVDARDRANAGPHGCAHVLHEDCRIEPNLSLKRRILFATTEMADYVKVGGLGEVSAALPRALRRDFDVRILIPGYSQVSPIIKT